MRDQQHSLRDHNIGFRSKAGVFEPYAPKRGKIKNVYAADHPMNRSGIPLADVELADYAGFLHKVPLCLGTKISATNGQEQTAEVGDYVLVQFVDGIRNDPVITGFLPPYLGGVALATTADAPRRHWAHQGTYETIDKAGNRTLHVDGYENIHVTGDSTIQIDGNAVIKAETNGKTITLKAGTVIVDGDLEVSGDVSDGTGKLSTLRNAYNGHSHVVDGASAKSPPTPLADPPT